MTAPAIGHNQPPDAIGLAESTIEELRQFLRDFPVIASEDEARQAKALIDRTVISLKAIEEERKSKVDPLNAQVKAINTEYHKWHNTDEKRPGIWTKFAREIRSRLTAYARRLEAERLAAAEAAHAAKEEAERLARQAEEREQQASADAVQGICDVDLGGAMANADAAFADFKRAGRELERAERDTKVRVGGGFGRVMTLRDKETLSVTDWKAAIEEMSDDDGEPPAIIADAVLTAARAYRKAYDRLPAGISVAFERSL